MPDYEPGRRALTFAACPHHRDLVDFTASHQSGAPISFWQLMSLALSGYATFFPNLFSYSILLMHGFGFFPQEWGSSPRMAKYGDYFEVIDDGKLWT
jgi:hypothetical protein